MARLRLKPSAEHRPAQRTGLCRVVGSNSKEDKGGPQNSVDLTTAWSKCARLLSLKSILVIVQLAFGLAFISLRDNSRGSTRRRLGCLRLLSQPESRRLCHRGLLAGQSIAGRDAEELSAEKGDGKTKTDAKK
jgi:hypothetical protein